MDPSGTKSSSSSKSSKNRRSSILKVRQTTVEAKVDVVEQPKNRRRVSFHHQKTVKEYDKEKHELSATSPLKEAVREAMSDFDSTKSNSTMMSLGTPDRTTSDNQTMMLFRGMMSAGHPSSVHHETKDMSFSIIEEPGNGDSQDDTLNVFNGLHAGHMTMHSKTVDISYRMEETLNENDADNTLDIFKKPSMNQSSRTSCNMTMDMDISKADNTLTDGVFDGEETMAIFVGAPQKKDTTTPLDNTMDMFTSRGRSSDKSLINESILMEMSGNPSPASQDRTMAIFGGESQSNESVAMEEVTMVEEEEKVKMETPTSITSIANPSKEMDESQSPGLEDTMAIFKLDKQMEAGDDYVRMDISIGTAPTFSQDSPTMNLFKRKGEDDMESDDTMHLFESKRWREDGDASGADTVDKEGLEDVEGAQESMEESALIKQREGNENGSGVNGERMNGSVMIEEKKEEKE
ncbi:hypothetical protein PMAYCL1PPCAC_07237, partial [Pristionchus mayeri]